MFSIKNPKVMIDFLKYRLIYLILSVIVIGAGLISIARWGYIYSIDFVGGTNLEYEINKKVAVDEIRSILKSQKADVIELSSRDRDISMRLKAIDEKKEAQIKKTIEEKLDTKVVVLKSETVGPVLGKETIKKTLIASLAAILGILLYMSFAFKSFDFALSAIIALLHDFLVVIGSYSITSHFFGAQVDTLFVTALLTTMSFSVHDTIIIFDRIREYFQTEGKGNLEFYSNRALTETLVRSLNNSMTTIFLLLALALIGGSTIRFFIITLLIGTITGTYSSPFVATPVLVWLEKRRKK